MHCFEEKSPMKLPRSDHSMCAMTDRFIIATGSNIFDEGIASTCEIFEVRRNEWRDLPNMNTPRYMHSSATFNATHIYVFCGITNKPD